MKARKEWCLLSASSFRRPTEKPLTLATSKVLLCLSHILSGHSRNAQFRFLQTWTEFGFLYPTDYLLKLSSLVIALYAQTMNILIGIIYTKKEFLFSEFTLSSTG